MGLKGQFAPQQSGTIRGKQAQAEVPGLWESNQIEQRIDARLEGRLGHGPARCGAPRAGQERRASLERVRAEPRVADQLHRIGGIGH
jgi:hypothetical protein